jgi:hypothetical protein
LRGQLAPVYPAILDTGKNKDLLAELLEFIGVKIDQMFFEEIPCIEPHDFPLSIHVRYTREKIYKYNHL